MKTIRFSFVLLLCLMAIEMFAQECTIKGQVVEAETKESIPSLPILITGTTAFAVTDFDGNFTIKTKIGTILVFKFLSHETQEIVVTEKLVLQSSQSATGISVALKPNPREIEGAIVTGYYKQSKGTATEAVEVVDGKNLRSAIGNNIDAGLQGKSGVYVTTGGAPGASSKVVMRGFGSVNSSDPLYVVDGVPQSNSPSINPLDVKSITILKDASACAIYGSRGANGVIVVTTKGGKMTQQPRESEYTYRFRKNHSYRATMFVVDSIIVDSVFNFKRMGFKERQVDTFYLDRQKNGLLYVFMATKPVINQNLKTVSTDVKQWIMKNPKCAIYINDSLQTSKADALITLNTQKLKSVKTIEKLDAEKKYGTLGNKGVLEILLE